MVRDKLRKQFQLNNHDFKALLSPASDAYKKKGLQPFATRSKLISLSTQTSNWIELSTMEGERDVWTPTATVLSELNTLHQPEIATVFVCGADVLGSWMRPNVWSNDDLERILSGYLAVVTRSDSKHSPKEVLEQHEIFITNPTLREKVIIVEDVLEDVLSSTHIRDSLLAGQSVKYLVPDAVNEYLLENEVYTEESMKINAGANVFDDLAKGKIVKAN